MSAPSSDPPLPPNENNNNNPQDNKDSTSPAPAADTTNAQVASSENEPLLPSSTDAPTEDVTMEDMGPKTEDDKFEDIPEGVLSVSRRHP